MTVFSSRISTDLAVESIPSDSAADLPGIRTAVRKEDGICITEMEVLNREGEQKTGRARGNYCSLDIGKIWYASPEQQLRTARCIAGCCRRLVQQQGNNLQNASVLVAGLGNREITADCLGSKTADRLNITRHLKHQQPELFDQLAGCEVAAITPGVSGQTGMETTDILRAVVQAIRPGYIIAVDALAARSTDRLATTVQLTDTGISPGSGIGNHRTAVNAETLGVPVIGIGVPTVVSSSTLICDALEKADIHSISPRLEALLANGRSFFVSLKESDIAVHALAGLLSRALNIALNNDYE